MTLAAMLSPAQVVDSPEGLDPQLKQRLLGGADHAPARPRGDDPRAGNNRQRDQAGGEDERQPVATGSAEPAVDGLLDEDGDRQPAGGRCRCQHDRVGKTAFKHRCSGQRPAQHVQRADLGAHRVPVPSS